VNAIAANAIPADFEAALHLTLVTADRACCCPARPVVIALIPPAAGRPHSTDVLLCGHHYKACAGALEAIGAAVLDSRSARQRGHDLGPALLPSAA
jgi:hypothetical protein